MSALSREDRALLALLDFDRPLGAPFEHFAAADALIDRQDHLGRLLVIAHEELGTRLPGFPRRSRLAAREARGGPELRDALLEDVALVEAAGDRGLAESMREALADVADAEQDWTTAYHEDCAAVERAVHDVNARHGGGTMWLTDEAPTPDGWMAPSRDEDRYPVCGRYAVDRAEPVGTPVDDRLWHVVLYDSATEGWDPWRPWGMWSTIDQVVAVLEAEN